MGHITESAGPRIVHWHPLPTALVTETWSVPGAYVQGNPLAMDLGTSLKAWIFMHNGFTSHPMGR